MIKITLTEDHIKLIPFFFVQEFGDNEVGVTKEQLFNIGSHLLEDMAMILGLNEKAINNTAYDAEGRAYDDETEKYMLGLYNYIVENLYYIELIIHQFVIKGGISPGTYKALDNELFWEKIS